MDETPGPVEGPSGDSERWLWLGQWMPRRTYRVGPTEHGVPLIKDEGHVYVCLYEHFSTEYSRPGWSSFWHHQAEFCCGNSEN